MKDTITARFAGKHIVLAVTETLNAPFTGIPDGEQMFPCDIVPRIFEAQADAERWAVADAVEGMERIAATDGVKTGEMPDFAEVHFICEVKRVYRPVPKVAASISASLRDC